MGCSANDDSSLTQATTSSYWMSCMGSRIGEVVEEQDDNVTRSVFYGGSTGTKFIQAWDTSDKPLVFKDGVQVGTLTPIEYGGWTTVLSGTLNGSFAPGDELRLCIPAATFDWRNQKGDVGSMSSSFFFMDATATIADVNGSTVTTNEISFYSISQYFRFNLCDENNKLLPIKKLTLRCRDGEQKIVETMNPITGEITYTDQLVVTPDKVKSTDEYPYEVVVAIRHKDGVGTVYYSTTVESSDGKTYYLSDTGWPEMSQNPVNRGFVAGAAVRFYRKMKCINVDAGVSTSITPPSDEDVVIDDVTKD